MAVANSGAAWLDRARGRDGPIYLAIVHALEAAVRGGELQPGERLPAQPPSGSMPAVEVGVEPG